MEQTENARFLVEMSFPLPIRKLETCKPVEGIVKTSFIPSVLPAIKFLKLKFCRDHFFTFIHYISQTIIVITVS